MALLSIRVLVAEDFAPFRRAVILKLRKEPGFQVISEVSDGLEVVQKAHELQPDVVVLDVGLPTLSGIEAARRIRRLSPRSKIVFVSQESSVEVVKEAFSLGANAYVIKSDAGRDLLIALKAVFQGETFVSRTLACHDLERAPDLTAGESNLYEKISPAHLEQNVETAHRHSVVFYSNDVCLIGEVSQLIGAALKVGNAGIVLASEPHRDDLLTRLETDGVDVARVIEEGRYMSLSAADVLSQFMSNGMVDSARFTSAFSDLIATAAKGRRGEHARVVVFGECVQLLCAQGNTEAALQMERLGNALTKSYDVDILCGYPLSIFCGTEASHLFKRICVEHSRVYSCE